MKLSVVALYSLVYGILQCNSVVGFLQPLSEENGNTVTDFEITMGPCSCSLRDKCEDYECEGRKAVKRIASDSNTMADIHKIHAKNTQVVDEKFSSKFNPHTNNFESVLESTVHTPNGNVRRLVTRINTPAKGKRVLPQQPNNNTVNSTDMMLLDLLNQTNGESMTNLMNNTNNNHQFVRIRNSGQIEKARLRRAIEQQKLRNELRQQRLKEAELVGEIENDLLTAFSVPNNNELTVPSAAKVIENIFGESYARFNPLHQARPVKMIRIIPSVNNNVEEKFESMINQSGMFGGFESNNKAPLVQLVKPKEGGFATIQIGGVVKANDISVNVENEELVVKVEIVTNNNNGVETRSVQGVRMSVPENVINLEKLAVEAEQEIRQAIEYKNNDSTPIEYSLVLPMNRKAVDPSYVQRHSSFSHMQTRIVPVVEKESDVVSETKEIVEELVDEAVKDMEEEVEREVDEQVDQELDEQEKLSAEMIAKAINEAIDNVANKLEDDRVIQSSSDESLTSADSTFTDNNTTSVTMEGMEEAAVEHPALTKLMEEKLQSMENNEDDDDMIEDDYDHAAYPDETKTSTNDDYETAATNEEYETDGYEPVLDEDVPEVPETRVVEDEEAPFDAEDVIVPSYTDDVDSPSYSEEKVEQI